MSSCLLSFYPLDYLAGDSEDAKRTHGVERLSLAVMRLTILQKEEEEAVPNG
jgi:hypothetical protein